MSRTLPVRIAGALVALAALTPAACAAVPEPSIVPAAGTSAATSAASAGAREAAALAWVRRGTFPSTASVTLAGAPSTWIGRKSEGIFFVVRVTTAAEVAEFYFERGSGTLDAVAIKPASGEARVFDRLTVPESADLARLTAQLRAAGGQP